MSTREWKPGDVAMVKCSDGEWRRASYFEMTFDPPAWVFQDNSRRRVADSVARRLVVIDDEDREQVERLIRAQVGSRAGCSDALVVSASSVDTMQAALRSLIAPLKPPEPTDPRARVTDFRENVWRLLADGDWVCVSGPDVGEYLAWWQLADTRAPLEFKGWSE